jgi:DNA-binding NarL/FixJ family response regulator
LAPCRELRVVIAEPDPGSRSRFRSALEPAGIVVCAEAGDAEGAVKAVEEHKPDVVLLAVHMPGGGIQAAWEITDRTPTSAVVMLTGSQEDEHLFGALQAGAVGYLIKGLDPQRLPDILQGVLRGEAALPRSLVSRVVDEFRARGRRLDLLAGRNSENRLTTREWEVLELLREGRSTAEIGERLYISRVTVRTHVSAILRKLRVPDRAAAVRYLDEQSRHWSDAQGA